MFLFQSVHKLKTLLRYKHCMVVYFSVEITSRIHNNKDFILSAFAITHVRIGQQMIEDILNYLQGLSLAMKDESDNMSDTGMNRVGTKHVSFFQPDMSYT